MHLQYQPPIAICEIVPQGEAAKDACDCVEVAELLTKVGHLNKLLNYIDLAGCELLELRSCVSGKALTQANCLEWDRTKMCDATHVLSRSLRAISSRSAVFLSLCWSINV